MDELDHNLLDAWNRVFERCRRDPAEARRRYERMHAGGLFDRPPRAWCVALRASDTRLTPGVGSGESAVGGESQDLKRWMSGVSRSADTAVEDFIRAQTAHEIVVDGDMIRELCRPVDLRYPGLPMREAAAELGRDPASIKKWLPVRIGKTVAQKEAFVQERYRSGSGRGERRWAEYLAEETGRGVLNVRYVPAGAAGRRAGMAVPVVWCDHLLDPGGFMGRPPSRWWGTMWKYLADEVPGEYEQALVREPVVQPYGGGDRFRGWQWRCPGVNQAPKAADGIGGFGLRAVGSDVVCAAAGADDRGIPGG